MGLEKITARGCDGLYRDAESKIIYFRQFRKGRGELKKSLKTKDLELAKKKRDDLRELLLGKDSRLKALAKQSKTALELFDAWITRKEELNKAPATITSMKSSRKWLAPHLETMIPDEITAEWWESIYIRETRAKSHKARKFFNDRKWLVSFLKQLVEDGIITRVPKLANPDPEETIGKIYTNEEVSLLLNFAQNEDLHLAILMAATMGMRRNEVFALRADRVDLEKGLIRLRREDVKTRKARAFSISPSTLPFLFKRCQAGNIWVFPSKTDKHKPLHKDGFYTAWDNLKKICSVEGRYHDLRHTFLTNVVNAPGANLAHISKYAGVSIEVLMKVYYHPKDEDSRAVATAAIYE